MSKEQIKGLPEDTPQGVLQKMKDSIAEQAGVPAEDITFDGDVVRLVNGQVIGQIKTEEILDGAMAVSISGKKFGGEGKKKVEVIATDEPSNPADALTKLLTEAGDAHKKMATVQIEGNQIVIEALEQIEEMSRDLRKLLKKVNGALEDLQK